MFRDVTKLAVVGVSTFGAQLITSTVLRTFIPGDLNKLTQVCVSIGGWGINLAVGKAVGNAVEDTVDEVFDIINDIKDTITEGKDNLEEVEA